MSSDNIPEFVELDLPLILDIVSKLESDVAANLMKTLVDNRKLDIVTKILDKLETEETISIIIEFNSKNMRKRVNTYDGRPGSSIPGDIRYIIVPTLREDIILEFMKQNAQEIGQLSTYTLLLILSIIMNILTQEIRTNVIKQIPRNIFQGMLQLVCSDVFNCVYREIYINKKTEHLEANIKADIIADITRLLSLNVSHELIKKMYKYTETMAQQVVQSIIKKNHELAFYMTSKVYFVSS